MSLLKSLHSVYIERLDLQFKSYHQNYHIFDYISVLKKVTVGAKIAWKQDAFMIVKFGRFYAQYAQHF